MRAALNDDLDTRDDGELLALVAARTVEPAAARAAEGCFYRRHVRYLYGTLKRREAALQRITGTSVEDLVQETFQRAFHYAGSYRIAPSGDLDRDRRQTRAWLGRIAHNLFIDSLSEVEEVSASPWIERATMEAEEEAPPSTPEVQALRKGLEELTDREQDVLRVTALYHRAGDGAQRLPNEVSAELASRWNTNNENIRAIRSRAMKKLEKFLQAAGVVKQEAR